MSVQEIIMPQLPTHIPKSPAFMEGVINLRGRVIPIIDGKKKFALESDGAADQKRIIILDVEHEIIGLIVDEVNEVIHLPTESIEPLPVDAEEETDFIWGVGKFGKKLVILINPAKFLSHHEVHDLKKVAQLAGSIASVQEEVQSVKPKSK
jgi:purine-binding chemotaxis protein CheW